MIHARRARNRRSCIQRFRPISITSFFKEVTGRLYVTVTLSGPFPDRSIIAEEKKFVNFPLLLANPACLCYNQTNKET